MTISPLKILSLTWHPIVDPVVAKHKNATSLVQLMQLRRRPPQTQLPARRRAGNWA